MTNALQAQRTAYRTKVRDLWLKEGPMIALAAAAVVFGLSWLLVTKTGGPQTGPGTIDWRLGATCIWLILMIPPIKMMYPDKPTEESVAHDRVLNVLGEHLVRQGGK